MKHRMTLFAVFWRLLIRMPLLCSRSGSATDLYQSVSTVTLLTVKLAAEGYQQNLCHYIEFVFNMMPIIFMHFCAFNC